MSTYRDEGASNSGFDVALRLERPLHLVLPFCAIGFLLAFLWIALSRWDFPFALEWMEGGSVDHVVRLLGGQEIYVEPSAAFTPYAYPPLYYYLSEIAARYLGPSLPTLRLVSLTAAIALFLLLGILVYRETQSSRAALISVGLFAAAYSEGGAWLDLARVDSLYLLLLCAALWAAREERFDRTGALSAIFVALCFLTKQTVLPFIPWLCIAIAASSWKRALRVFCFSGSLVCMLVLLLSQQTEGWFSYYIFQHPRERWGVFFLAERVIEFWLEDIFYVFPFAALLGLWLAFYLRSLKQYRDLWFYSWILGGLLVVTLWTRMERNAFANNLIPAHLALAWIAGIAYGKVLGLRQASPAGSQGRSISLFAGLLVALQFNSLRYDPKFYVPQDEERDRVRAFTGYLAGLDTTPLLPYRPFVDEALSPPLAHVHAINDLLSTASPRIIAKLERNLVEFYSRPEIKLVILNNTDWYRSPALMAYFSENFESTAAVEAIAGELWPHTGFGTKPYWILTRKPD